MRLGKTLAVAVGLGPAALAAFPVRAGDGPPPGALAELRRGFTLGGAPVPPLVFRDMGDGDAADPAPTLVAVDAWAAIGSDRYAGAIRTPDGLVTQTGRPSDDGRGTETERYHYLGATPDGLMVLVTEASSSEANFAPATLHVVEAAVARGLDPDGRPYDRVVVTVLAGYPLGDGWRGRATLAGDTVTVVTVGGAMHPPGAGGDTRTYRIARP